MQNYLIQLLSKQLPLINDDVTGDEYIVHRVKRYFVSELFNEIFKHNFEFTQYLF